jgi:hypothetical protein
MFGWNVIGVIFFTDGDLFIANQFPDAFNRAVLEFLGND